MIVIEVFIKKLMPIVKYLYHSVTQIVLVFEKRSPTDLKMLVRRRSVAYNRRTVEHKKHCVC